MKTLLPIALALFCLGLYLQHRMDTCAPQAQAPTIACAKPTPKPVDPCAVPPPAGEAPATPT